MSLLEGSFSNNPLNNLFQRNLVFFEKGISEGRNLDIVAGKPPVSILYKTSPKL